MKLMASPLSWPLVAGSLVCCLDFLPSALSFACVQTLWSFGTINLAKNSRLVAHFFCRSHCHSKPDCFRQPGCQHSTSAGHAGQLVRRTDWRLAVWCRHDHDARVCQPLAHFVSQRQFTCLDFWLGFCRHCSSHNFWGIGTCSSKYRVMVAH